jgi:tRNA G10  N-methylase Trm11
MPRVSDQASASGELTNEIESSLQSLPEITPLSFDSTKFDSLTHYLFRYPAKFHPPAVRVLLERYTQAGDRVLDPFCGSGSLLVEAGVLGRHALGTDVDPVAVFASQVKVCRYDHSELYASYLRLSSLLRRWQRSKEEYSERQFLDLSPAEVDQTIDSDSLWIPAVPNLYHWFRRYVVIDLARIYREITQLSLPPEHRQFFLLCFASVIRSASNADPVPVSGLEVTSHMKRKDALGRVIDPFHLFDRSVQRALPACAHFSSLVPPSIELTAFQADATEVGQRIKQPVDCIITSPPYHNAVDYYRRHQLEMFWLGFTRSQEDRLSLLPHYMGRPKVPMKHPYLTSKHQFTPLVETWESRIRAISTARASAFRHYMMGMYKAFQQFASLLTTDKYAILVVGHSSWNGSEIPTAALLVELATPHFDLAEHLWYPLRNRYMSYSRRNGASIDREYVLVFRRTHSSTV